MALELTEDFIKDNGLSQEQATAFTNFGNKYVDEHTAVIKKEYDGVAIANTDKMLDGVISHTQKESGFELDRNQGEKHGDYLKRFNTAFLANEKSVVEKLKGEFEDKIKNFKGDSDTKQKLEDTLEALSTAQKTIADNTPLLDKASKYDDLEGKYLTIKEEVCFGKEKPNFPDTIDEYRASAKWGEFVSNIKKDYLVELVNGISTAISKENEHLTIPLKDLVEKDESISKLMEGRKQKGANGKETNLLDVEGVPFKVPENADSKIRAELISKHLTDKGLSTHSPEWSSEFAKLNTAILSKK